MQISLFINVSEMLELGNLVLTGPNEGWGGGTVSPFTCSLDNAPQYGLASSRLFWT